MDYSEVEVKAKIKWLVPLSDNSKAAMLEALRSNAVTFTISEPIPGIVQVGVTLVFQNAVALDKEAV